MRWDYLFGDRGRGHRFVPLSLSMGLILLLYMVVC